MFNKKSNPFTNEDSVTKTIREMAQSNRSSAQLDEGFLTGKRRYWSFFVRDGDKGKWRRDGHQVGSRGLYDEHARRHEHGLRRPQDVIMYNHDHKMHKKLSSSGFDTHGFVERMREKERQQEK